MEVENTNETAEVLTDEQLETLTAPDKGKNGKQKEHKPIKYSLPFGQPVFSRPEREWKEERQDRKGNKTGVISQLMANVSIPMVGNILTINTAIYCDTKYDREVNAYVDTYSFTVGKRYTFGISDEGRKYYDTWRDTVLGMFDKWLDSDAAKTPIHKQQSTTPRLVKVRPALTTPQPAA